MLENHFGEIIALITAGFWTVTALMFEQASKKVGSLVVNLLRLFFAFFLFSIFTRFTKGLWLPTDASMHAWIWLSISGLVGFVIGDLFLFKSYTIIGARIAMLIMALSPPIAAFFGWIILGEILSVQNIIGMIITLTGIAMVILTRKSENTESVTKKVKFRYPILGLFLAFLGAIGQAVGLVLSKYGMQDYDPFAATQIRVLTGIIGFAIIFTFFKRWDRVIPAFKNRKALNFILIGAVFGPFLGVAFSLWSIKFTSTGIAMTIMSTIPVLIIPPAILIYKDKVKPIEIIGAIVTVIGVSLFFL
jgi:drug/metabolite transporter (DMT)-like permease